MLVISSREFRDNQKKYMDLADSNQQVVEHSLPAGNLQQRQR